MNRINPRWLVAFAVLVLAVHEAHELAHTLAGRAMCGEWATRDFNVWRLPEQCTSWLPTAAGPVFSFGLMLLGVAISRRGDRGGPWLGVALIFATNPLARVITVGMGGGDEVVVARALSGGSVSPAAYWTTAALVAALAASGVSAGWAAIAGTHRRIAWFVAVLLLPMALTGTLLFVVFNGMLRAGILAQPTVMGTPQLVVLVTIVVAVLALFIAPWLRNQAR